jgi:hypothetical protein
METNVFSDSCLIPVLMHCQIMRKNPVFTACGARSLQVKTCMCRCSLWKEFCEKKRVLHAYPLDKERIVSLLIGAHARCACIFGAPLSYFGTAHACSSLYLSLSPPLFYYSSYKKTIFSLLFLSQSLYAFCFKLCFSGFILFVC